MSEDNSVDISMYGTGKYTTKTGEQATSWKGSENNKLPTLSTNPMHNRIGITKDNPYPPKSLIRWNKEKSRYEPV